ncbi:MAG: YggS family pyridoxal phosphate-dependent enzyme [Paludibacter sp.]|nr:YggS family pyridoxal phosphate-dependent enzyme [Bacteroidales bacterium]MCM1069430.1 YggS family pyridoxal phosphate-dependent enzyme [Prevotella sp.]MCM1353805.1 YggS family pyridoxal phosphate-dependent enzyme [Bacteroides sp.]MCM1442794.1 YggS family pyridoxal phosphate-dependent enzyme [Muribaculum sp.]MCM1481840.1 YggS family pyridoxal phosphate-dependent enzyme [Paludibacter sp.]
MADSFLQIGLATDRGTSEQGCSIASSLADLHNRLPNGVQLLCVSKYYPEEAVLEAYRAGERKFGESRVQELCRKYETLPKDIQWHFIGHLQTNKIRTLLPMVSLIHGVDSWRLLTAINTEAERLEQFRNTEKRVNVLLEIKVACETTKYGFSPETLLEMFRTMPWQQLQHINICGLMGMASHTDNVERVREEFAMLHRLFVQIRNTWFSSYQNHFNTLSMGMTDDWHIAVTEGSTLVRIGSGIFGNRG